VTESRIKALIPLVLLFLFLRSPCPLTTEPTSNPELNEDLPGWCSGALILVAILIGILDMRRERETKRKRERPSDDD
jgi:hypothetical protein